LAHFFGFFGALTHFGSVLSASMPSLNKSLVEKKRLAVFVPQVEEFTQLMFHQK
jgi:hypothetical protein